MRTKQAFKNASMSLVLQVVLAVSGVLIPRFFIELYGSPVNGLVQSITQFISYMSLVEAGIGAAGTVALYKPIADNNQPKINSIVSAAKSFYYRSGMIFFGLVAALVVFYPYAVKNEIGDVSFIRTMIVILSLNGIVDYFYLGKYRVLLNADQKGYIISLAQIIGTVIMTVVCILLMKSDFAAGRDFSLVIKGVNAAIYILRSLIVGLYVKKKYPNVKFNSKPDFKAYDQRWAALLHQIVGMIVNNTAVILMTLLLSENALAEISVFGVYNLVAYSLYGVMNSISSGLNSGFGEVISKGETDVLNRSYSNYEYVFFLIIFVAYTCMAVLLYPFIGLYSATFTDAIYLRWSLVALFTLSGLLQCLRLPGLTLICAAGHYKQTKWRAITEASINLIVSLALVKPLGINGVLIGMCASYLYRTTDVIVYSAKHFVKGTLKLTAWRILRNLAVSAALIAGGIWLLPSTAGSWLGWILQAVVFGVAALVLIVGLNIVCEPKEFKNLLGRVKDIIGRS